MSPQPCFLKLHATHRSKQRSHLPKHQRQIRAQVGARDDLCRAEGYPQAADRRAAELHRLPKQASRAVFRRRIRQCQVQRPQVSCRNEAVLRSYRESEHARPVRPRLR